MISSSLKAWVPGITWFFPIQQNSCSDLLRTARRLYHMSNSFAAIAGGAGVVLATLAIISFFYCWKLRHKNSSNRNSETSSSNPPAFGDISTVELRRVPTSSTGPSITGRHGATQFTKEALDKATKHFHEKNIIGYGSFGLVYKGLLCDGTFVAIKRRSGVPQQELVEQITYLSRIWHRNLVTLLGYCQESGFQMLVFEYLPNGSLCNHLHGQDTITKLDFKQRLSIGLGAAKGLCHLHSQRPPIVHGSFKTANVLVDENFIAKVADAGICQLLLRMENANPSASQDPQRGRMEEFSEMNDVYSFGVFLLELVTGQQASHVGSLGSNEILLQWVQTLLSSNKFVDHRLEGSFTTGGMNESIRLMLQCTSFPAERRPTMEMVVRELDRILEKEITLTTVTGESSTTVTLGSQLFTSTSG
ncbi:Non-specific serine/threonine protein kinase [Bertholletia excelsa]